MATQISINTSEAASIYSKAMEHKSNISDEPSRFTSQIMDLPVRDVWKSDLKQTDEKE